MVDLDAALDQQLLDVAVGQVVPQVPAHRDHDHLRREPEPGERRPVDLGMADTTTMHRHSLLPTDAVSGRAARSTQQSPFWLVHDPRQTVLVTLRDDHYSQLVIEVDDPEATIALVSQALIGPGLNGK